MALRLLSRSAGSRNTDGNQSIFLSRRRRREEGVIAMKSTRSTTQHAFVLILALLGLVGVATFALEPLALAQVSPSWVPTGSLNIPRYLHTVLAFELSPPGSSLGGYRV
jgi:hypothetical protein